MAKASREAETLLEYFDLEQDEFREKVVDWIGDCILSSHRDFELVSDRDLLSARLRADLDQLADATLSALAHELLGV